MERAEHCIASVALCSLSRYNVTSCCRLLQLDICRRDGLHLYQWVRTNPVSFRLPLLGYIIPHSNRKRARHYKLSFLLLCLTLRGKTDILMNRYTLINACSSRDIHKEGVTVSPWFVIESSSEETANLEYGLVCEHDIWRLSSLTKEIQGLFWGQWSGSAGPRTWRWRPKMNRGKLSGPF